MEQFNIKSESQLAKKVGMAQTTVNKLITGATADPRISTLTPIAEHFKISVDTLLSENPKFDQENFHTSNDILSIQIPLINFDELIDLHSGIQSLSTNNWPHWYSLNTNQQGLYFALYLTESMSNLFQKGSVVTILKDLILSNNSYVLLKHIETNTLTIKRVKIDGGDCWLLPLLPELPAAAYEASKWESLGSLQTITQNLSDNNFLFKSEV
jgi:transcriptional regulator with XRE-family HTH domain